MGDFIGHHVDTDANFLRFAVNFITKPLEMLLYKYYNRTILFG